MTDRMRVLDNIRNILAMEREQDNDLRIEFLGSVRVLEDDLACKKKTSSR